MCAITSEQQKCTRFSHAEAQNINVDGNIVYAFANAEIGLRVFLTVMVTNCSTERLFSQLKRINNHNRTAKQQGRLNGLSKNGSKCARYDKF